MQPCCLFKRLEDENETRSTSEARSSLTKFVSTISIMIFMEALVTIFRVSHTDVADPVYPSALPFTAVVMIISLSAFQYISSKVEAKVGTRDQRAQDRKR